MARLAVLYNRGLASPPAVKQDRVQDGTGSLLIGAVVDEPVRMVRDGPKPSPLADYVDPAPEVTLKPDPVGACPSLVLVDQLQRNTLSCCLIDPLAHTLLGLLCHCLLCILPVHLFSACSVSEPTLEKPCAGSLKLPMQVAIIFQSNWLSSIALSTVPRGLPLVRRTLGVSRSVHSYLSYGPFAASLLLERLWHRLDSLHARTRLAAHKQGCCACRVAFPAGSSWARLIPPAPPPLGPRLR